MRVMFPQNLMEYRQECQKVYRNFSIRTKDQTCLFEIALQLLGFLYYNPRKFKSPVFLQNGINVLNVS